MSYSSLWVIDNNLNGEIKSEFNNSWLFSPIAWDILLDKYLPGDENRNYITAVMFDKQVFSDLNEKINNSEIQDDRIVWELTNQQVFSTKDKKFISDCIMGFALDQLLEDHIFNRFKEISKEILDLDEELNPYFIFKNTSVDDNVEVLFENYNEDKEEYEKSSLKDLKENKCEFVLIKDNKIIGFAGNLEFLKANMPVNEEQVKEIKNICWEYCDFIKTEMETYTPGNYDYSKDKQRDEIHWRLCEAFGVQKSDYELKKITNRLDEIDYSGDILYKKINEVITSRLEN